MMLLQCSRQAHELFLIHGFQTLSCRTPSLIFTREINIYRVSSQLSAPAPKSNCIVTIVKFTKTDFEN